MNDKMKKDIYYYELKELLNKLEGEGVESVYSFVKDQQTNGGSSIYSAAMNDIVAHCPTPSEWKNIGARRQFEFDVRYYCEYYLAYYEDE